MDKRVLLVEDELSLRRSLCKWLRLKGYSCDEAENLKMANQRIRLNDYDIVLLDLRLPDGGGLELLRKFPQKLKDLTIVLTAHATIASAVEAIQLGAFNYLEKPVNEDLLFLQMERILELHQLKENNQTLKRELISQHCSDELIFQSPEMDSIISFAKKIAKSEVNILIQGETGVGKEVVARFIHKHSSRKGEIFLPLNCSSIPDHLFESELFGFKKGAFTGATRDFLGKFGQAHRGTLFLDEIGEVPLALQSKLLRVLEEQWITPLGSNKPKKIDVRIIAASNKDLYAEVQGNRFRRDLYFRLKEAVIHLPPLKERTQDILPLTWHFISLFNRLTNKNFNLMSAEAQDLLLTHSWEGNIRELKNVIRQVYSIKEKGNSIDLKDIQMVLKKETNRSVDRPFMTLEQRELKYIREVLQYTDHNIKRSAQILGISRSRLYRKIKADPNV